jgi:hypothetical protein
MYILIKIKINELYFIYTYVFILGEERLFEVC